MVLVPEIADAVGTDAHVLAAGGIGSGRQVAAALSLGADGVWMGSYWLTTAEYQLGNNDAMQRALVAAGSDQTVRTRIYSGKPARLLKTRWTEAWAEAGAPDALPMPLQNLLVAEAHQRIAASDDPSVVAMPVGQIVGRMNSVRPVAELVDELVAEFHDTLGRLDKYR
jgi:NAD(P)H-dependent flavin oxidoreductase YrpB (nitropropane dioxygenase family)